jgi:N6-adenosine-specific RNA methylase IME4
VSQKYDVILADPPWHFKVWSEETGSGRSASQHYPTMSMRDILELPVSELAAENCALFLWTTWPMIFEAPKIMSAWGFTYRTEAWLWVKPRKDYLPQKITVGSHIILDSDWAMGLGYYTRANSEPCLLAVRGRMPVQDRGVLALITSPRREHSQKPDEQYAKIERLYPGMRYLELFARSKRPGWDAWGNEVESDIQLLPPAPDQPVFDKDDYPAPPIPPEWLDEEGKVKPDQ